jgi:endoribonuclease Dicer
LTKGKGANRTGPQELKHSLGEKTIADVCEAFIGAAFMQHNEYGKWDPEKWDQAVKAVKVLVDSEDHVMEKWSDYYGGYTKPDYQLAEATASQLDLAAKVEKKHPYHFKYPRLLRSAFVHPSQAFMWENVPNYQRLEFLGDSLLDQVFITHLFYRFPDKDPQWLTEHKMPMVSNKFLAAVCVKLGFHTHIRQNNAMLSSQIRNYVDEVEEAEHNAKGSLDYWNNTHIEPPKCLADVIEAYVAAIFVDSEFDFSVVQDFFDMHLAPFFDDITLYDNWAKNNPITRLNRLLNIGFGCRNWRLQCMAQPSVIPGVKDRVVAMVQIHYKVWFHGTADSNRYASPKVCHAALEKLEGLPPFEFRKQYGCDCEDDEEDVVMEDAEVEDKVEEAVEGADGILNGGPNEKAGLQGPDNAHADDYLEERLNKAIVELGKEDDDD